MAAMGVAVVGGPMTMSLLVLKATQDFSLTAVAITASLCASTLVRTAFSTWRLHTRGETIRSARDVGWVRLLTAGRLMRRGTPRIDAGASIAAFRRRFPLGAATAVVALDGEGRYVGIVRPAAAHDAALDGDAAVATILEQESATVPPELNAAEIMRQFELAEADELAVIDADRRVLGTVTERHVQKRYLGEMERAQRELFGE